MENLKKDNIIEIIKKSAMFLLMSIIGILLITTVLFFFKITITKFHLPIIYILTALAYMLFYKKDNIKSNLIGLIVSTVIFVTSICIIGNVYDSTADGNTYHKLAVGSLKNGWNPVYEDSYDFTEENGNVFNPSEENVNTNWVDHYAKATEIYGAVIYAFTGNIETGKIYTILLIYIGFGIIFSYLAKDLKINTILSFIISAVLVVNPITIVQIFNYYVDAALMISVFLILYACIVESTKKEYKIEKENLLILFSGIVLCINAKFTGVGFAGAFCAVFYFYWLYKSFKEGKEKFIYNLKVYTIFYVVTVITAIGIVGFSSYTRNMIDHGHPLYPLYGEGHVANMVMMEAPTSFQDKNHLEIFLISIFSKGENVSPSYSSENVQPTLKIPFTTTMEEIKNYNIPDIRIGGFGPLFSGVFIITIIGIIYIIIDLIRKKKFNILVPLLLILAVMAILILALDGGYWARYIPYLYVLPIFVLTYLLWNKENKIKFIIGIILAIIMLINSSLVLYTTIKNTKDNNAYIKARINQFIQYSNENENVEIKLNHMGLQGVLYNLDDLGIKDYVEKQEIQVEKDGYFFKY